MRQRLTIPAASAALLLFALRATGQEHPNIARGLSRVAGDAFEIDSINPFNGNLTLQIPLGPSYPVGPNLRFELRLVYNSQVWEYSGGTPIPVRLDNAGLGWRLSLGRLFAPFSSSEIDNTRWTYVSPDGASHVFYGNLHDGEAVSSDYFYTRDGTYLRLRASGRTVEFPNGLLHRFDSSGYPTRMEDRFGNWITVTYTRDPQGQITAWSIADVHGRSHNVYFTNSGSAYQRMVVSRVDLQPAAGNFRTPIYFQYSGDFGTLTQQAGCAVGAPVLALTLLNGVTLTDGTAYALPSNDYYLEPPPGVAGERCRSGRLARVTLPTLGKIEWDYGLYRFPNASTTRPLWQNTTGVSLRQLKDHNAAASGAPWLYSTAMNAANTELTNTSTQPSGTQVRRFFSVCVDRTFSPCANPESKFEYGLPLTRARAGDGAGRMLSSEIASGGVTLRRQFVRFQSDAITTTSELEDLARLNQRVETTRTVFNDDGNRYADDIRWNFDGHGHYRSRNLSGNFPGNSAKTIHTFFDAGGGTSPGQPGYQPWPTGQAWIPSLFTYIQAEDGVNPPRVQSFCFDSATGFLLARHVQASTAGSPQDLFEIYRRSTTAGSLGYVSDVYYLGGDVVPLPSGYGSQHPCVAAQDASLPNTAQFRLQNGYVAGALASSSWVVPITGALVLQMAKRTIDPSTGLPLSSSDSADFRTDFTYDSAWRVLSAVPQAGGRVVQSYRNPSVSIGALTRARLRTQLLETGTSAVMGEERVEVDAWGRPIFSETQTPSGLSPASTAFDEMGRLTYRSVLGAVGFGTSLRDFDAFGRPRTVRPPDGALHDVGLSYSGNSSTTRTVKIATGVNGEETNAATVGNYDRFGRLQEVIEPNGVRTKYEYDVDDNLTRVCQNAAGSSCGQDRRFNYDARGFLLSETHPEKSGAATYSMFNALGQPTSSQDSSGAPRLTTTYDGAGRVTEIAGRSPGGLIGFQDSKVFTYGTENSGSDLCKGKLTFTQRDSVYPLLGQVDKGGTTARVKEAFVYAGLGGRLSSKVTQLLVKNAAGGFDARESFTQDFAYDDAGQLIRETYPRCTNLCSLDATRRFDTTYSMGRVTSIREALTNQTMVQSVSYHASGMVHRIAHGNGVWDQWLEDPNKMGRPQLIEVWNGNPAAGGTKWVEDDGAYAYDGIGNVKSMGGHRHRYDSLGRLVGSKVYDWVYSTGNARTQNMSYDAYGNITSVSTDSTLLTPGPSTATNRIAGATYDGSGNETSWGGQTFTYDAFNNQRTWARGTATTYQVYTASDERFWAYTPATGASHWALRGLDGTLRREYVADGGFWTNYKDYAFREGVPVGELRPTSRFHFHVDHLGTVRNITNAAVPAAQGVSLRMMFPYGRQSNKIGDSMQVIFTGHERDMNTTFKTNACGTAPCNDYRDNFDDDDLDYMHARYYRPLLGRFTTPDPIGGNPRNPQSWNRYSYVIGNPVNLIDPWGLCPAGTPEPCFDDTIPVVGKDPGPNGEISPGMEDFFNARKRRRGESDDFFERWAQRERGSAILARTGALAGPWGDVATTYLEAWSLFLPVGETVVTAETLAANGAVVADFIRVGQTRVSRQLIGGPGTPGFVKTMALKGGGTNPRSGFTLPYHFHIHRYNWYRPHLWFRQTDILR